MRAHRRGCEVSRPARPKSAEQQSRWTSAAKAARVLQRAYGGEAHNGTRTSSLWQERPWPRGRRSWDRRCKQRLHASMQWGANMPSSSGGYLRPLWVEPNHFLMCGLSGGVGRPQDHSGAARGVGKVPDCQSLESSGRSKSGRGRQYKATAATALFGKCTKYNRGPTDRRLSFAWCVLRSARAMGRSTW